MEIKSKYIKFTDLQVVEALITEEQLKHYVIEKMELAKRSFMVKFRATVVAIVEVTSNGVEIEFLDNPQSKQFEKIIKSKYLDRSADYMPFFERR